MHSKEGPDNMETQIMLSPIMDVAGPVEEAAMAGTPSGVESIHTPQPRNLLPDLDHASGEKVTEPRVSSGDSGTDALLKTAPEIATKPQDEPLLKTAPEIATKPQDEPPKQTSLEGAADPVNFPAGLALSF